MNRRYKAYFYLLTTALIWGIASPVIKNTLQYIDPFSFLFWRFLIVSIILLPIYFIYTHKKKIHLTNKKVLKLSALGLLGTTFGLGLLFVGYKYTTAIDGSLIYSVSPIFVIIGGALLLKEKVTKMEKLGALVAFIGSIVTIIQPVLEGKAFALENIGGNILILFSAISWAAYCLLVRKFEYKDKDKTDPFVLTSIGFFAGLFTVIPIFLYENVALNNYLKSVFMPTQALFHLNVQALPGIIYMSIFSSIVAFLTYNLGYSLIEASEATIFDYVKPVFTAPIAVLWLGEKITLPFLTGAALIFLGIFLTEFKSKKLRKVTKS
ncbi:DMT family transporter [Patescibacteria group bacterium]